jgi:hypothetical protein
LPPAGCEYVTELAKALFNISLDSRAEDTAELLAVATSLHKLLNLNIDSLESRMSVHGSVINVVTNFEGRPELTADLFGANLANVRKLLDFLIYKIERNTNISSLKVSLRLNSVPGAVSVNVSEGQHCFQKKTSRQCFGSALYMGRIRIQSKISVRILVQRDGMRIRMNREK